MLQQTDVDALTRAISSERRLRPGPLAVLVLLVGTVLLVFGLIMAVLWNPYGVYPACVGIALLLVVLVNIPAPLSYSDDRFQNKVLHEATVEGLLLAVTEEARTELEYYLARDPARCIRVRHIHEMLVKHRVSRRQVNSLVANRS